MREAKSQPFAGLASDNNLDVVDTAVKVGLGAAVSSIGTLTLARINHKRDLSKVRLQGRANILENVADRIEGFTHIVLKYWAPMVEWNRCYLNDEIFPDERAQGLDKTQQEFFHSFKEMTHAEGQLLLLGERDAQRTLREYGERETQFRRKFSTSNLAMTEDELSKCRSELLAKRENVFEQLSEAYAVIRL